MKNKKLIIVSLTLLLAITVNLLSCMGSTLNKGAKMIDKSRDKFTLLTTQITVMDGEQTVYKYSESVEIVEGNAEITKSTSKLNSSFEFSTVEDIQVVENANRDKFINFVLDKNLITTVA